jgi:hypothetical protein
MELLWSLYNRNEQLRIDDLKTEHVRVILLAIPTRKMAEWYACRGGDIRWTPLLEVPEFFEDVRAIKGISPAPGAQTEPIAINSSGRAVAGSDIVTTVQKEARRPLFEDVSPEQWTTRGLEMEKESIKEKRSARRYPKRLQFSAKTTTQKFHCETLDISMNGLSLDQELPKWLGKKFQAKLEHGGLAVRIMCERVEDSRVKISKAESWDIIRTWIVNG